MPLYEYCCSSCNKTIEVIQRFSDPDLSICTECGGSLEKVLSAPAIRFKGSGWYVNDYAKSNGTGSSQKPETDSVKKDKSPPAETSSEPKGGAKSKSESKVA
jgi:putative FmdB family regulatory protein